MEINKIIDTYRIQILGILLIITTPLLTLPPLFFPPPWAQSIAFRIIFIILLCFLLKDVLLKPGYSQEIKNKILSIPLFVSVLLALYLVFIILSTVFSLQPAFSFWGSPYRGDGSFSLILYIIFAFLSYIIIKKDDWKKIWTFVLAVGWIVSLVAFAQQFQLLPENILVPYLERPPSTLGNTNFLATYLGLLIFSSFSFAIKEKIIYKRILYGLSFLIFLSAITLTFSRAAFLGLIVGAIWMIFFCKIEKPNLNKIKNVTGVLLLVIICLAVLYANTAKMPQFIEKNYLLNTFFSRLIINFGHESRFSSWAMIFPGVKDRPLLGAGPENFSIVFDKHFDPALTKITSAGGQWWDRAHNSLLEIALTTGIPSLITYLLFWTALFIFLQKTKKNKPEAYWILHGIQATIISYLTINFFGFDCPATYIFSFMLAGYSFIFIAKKNLGEEKQNLSSVKARGVKKFTATIIFVISIFFIWQYNIVPLQVNAKINWANYYLDKAKECQKAREELKPYLNSGLYINTYLKQVYANILAECAVKEKNSDKKIELIREGVEIAEDVVKQKPFYTKTWIYLGVFSGYLLEKNPNDAVLKEKIDFYFKEAIKLSPKRTISFYEWGKVYLAAGDCQKALNIGRQCIDSDAKSGDCWRLSALSNLCLDNEELYEKQNAEAEKNGGGTAGTDYLKYAMKIYSKLIEKNGPKVSYYQGLEKIYMILVQLNSESVQYRASLAYIYKALGKYKEAREQAMVVLGLSPESKAEVEAFLKTLPY